MKRFAWLLLCMTAAAPVLAAQVPRDTAHAGRRAAARQEFQRRRAARLRDALGLTDDQAAKLSATEQRFGEQRRAIFEQDQDLMAALRAQLRPGVAANADSVRKLLDARDQIAAKRLQLRRDEDHEMAAYLTPVQRAQLQVMRARGPMRFAHRMGRGFAHRMGRGRVGHAGWPRRGMASPITR